MASRDDKPKNSSDSEGETEWTFIDSDEGTIETRKDSVTYRKATYSEILKGVAAEDLVEEKESEPEFEVLASFKFRPKGESFGLGSSAPKAAANPKLQEKERKLEAGDDNESPNGDDSSCSDDDIMIISSNFDEESRNKAQAPASNSDECSSIDETNHIIKPACHKVEDIAAGSIGGVKDGKESEESDVMENPRDDDDFVITDDAESDFVEARVDTAAESDGDSEEDDDEDDEEYNAVVSDEELTESVNNNHLNESTIKDQKEQPLSKEIHDKENNVEPLGSDDSDGLPDIYKERIYGISNKDLAWDSLTFQLLSTFPRMSDSATTLGDDKESLAKQDNTDNIQDSDYENTSDINQDDSSSFEEISDPADENSEFRSDPMIPRWLFDTENNAEDLVESLDDDTDDIISDMEVLNVVEESSLVPCWLFDANFKREDIDEPSDDYFDFISSDKDDLGIEEANQIIPSWFFDPNHKIEHLDESFDDCTDYSDSEYDSDSDFDDDCSLTLPQWLFDENFKHVGKDEEGFFWSSHMFMDVPTFIILLFLTTALGFTIGHGLTVYFSDKDIDRNVKLPNLEIPSSQFAGAFEDLGLTPEEIAKIDLIKLEDELYRQKESDMLSEHLRFDLRELYKRLQKSHYRLLRNQKSTENRLHISKSMSWYWRLKYDEEKRQNQKTGLHNDLWPKNFKDMATLATSARKTELAKKWRRYKKNHTVSIPRKAKVNQKWLVNTLDEKLKSREINKKKAEFANRYWIKAMTLSKNNDMENFKRRWTQDFKNMKNKTYHTDSNKKAVLKKKISSMEANKSRCLKRGSSSESKKNIEPPADETLEIKNQGIQFRPCFIKSKNAKTEEASSDNEPVAAQNQPRHSASIVKRTKKKGEHTPRSHRHENIRRKRIKKSDLKTKKLGIERQVDELKRVLVGLRRERRRAEKEKAKLEASWRKLKRQRLQFEKEKVSEKKNYNKKVKRVKSKLTREKNRLKTWKSVAKRAQKKAKALNKDLKRVSLAKQKLKDITSIKKELKLEKRKLRKQQKNLKSMKQQLRKEHRNYAREKWKTKKKCREMKSGQEEFNYSEPQTKQDTKKGKKRNHYKKKHRRERPSTKTFRDEKLKDGKQKRFWKSLEERLYKWAHKVNKTIEHHRRGKASKIWNTLRNQFGRLMDWTTRKSSRPTKPVKKKKKRHSKRKAKMENTVFDKVLAEQMKFDKEKRNARKMNPEDQWKSRGPIINKRSKTPNDVKRKKERTNDPDALLRQRQRKQRRKYQRELERLQQWALQMNEKKLEHERIYKEKEEKNTKSSKLRRNSKSATEKERTRQLNSFSESRALVSADDSNGTLMLLRQPRSRHADQTGSKTNKKEEDPEAEDSESIILRLTKSQLNHESSKKKKTDTCLTRPIDDDVIKLPNDVNKANSHSNLLGISSFGEEGLSNPEPTPPSLSPTFYEDFPIIKIIEDTSPKKDVPMDVADILPPDGSKSQTFEGDDSDQRTQSWYMRRAEQRDISRNLNPTFTFFPRPIGPLKSDGTWFFYRSSDRAQQREMYEPLNRQSARDGFKHDSWRSYFHRGRRGNKIRDGSWVFDRASDRAEQRTSKDPWYMRRAEGREHDRDESKNSWSIERGLDRDQLHDYDEDDDEDDLMNDYDYYGDQDYEENDYSWNPTMY